MNARRYDPLSVLLVAVLAAPISGQGPETWVVDPEASVSIGAVEGAEEDVLVNVLMGAVLDDGTIALRNSIRGLFEIRYYRPDGSHITTASRFGQGPFEFRYPIGVHRTEGDSILVVGGDGRFAVFGASGERVREGRASPEAETSYGLIETRIIVPRYFGPNMPETGTRRAATSIVAYDLSSGQSDSVGVALGPLTHYERMTDRNGVHIYRTPFAPETFVRVGGGLIWIGDNATSAIQAYREDGSGPVVTIESPFEARETSRADRRRVRDEFAEVGSGDTRTRWARFARSMEVPTRYPSFGPLVVDRLGNLWVQEYEPYWAEGTQEWAVFSQGGAHIANVSLPPSAIPGCSRRPRRSCSHGTGIFDIGGDYLLLPQTDELGVRYVRKFSLRKPS